MGSKRNKNRGKKRHYWGNVKKQDGGPQSTNQEVNGTPASTSKISRNREQYPSVNDNELTKEAYVLFSVKNLCDFIENNTVCKSCQKTVKCDLDLSRRMGFYHKLFIRCTECPVTFYLPSSENTMISKTKSPKEINGRKVGFARSIGRGWSALKKFAVHPNSPPGLSRPAYATIFRHLHTASKSVAQESIHQAADELRQQKGVTDDAIVDCAASFDGTWQRRGFASHHGVVTSISVDTGKCLDYEILSNICKGCQYWEKQDHNSMDYLRWKADHRCRINHTGSAGSMETVATLRIALRSELSHNLRYTEFLGDGDSSSFSSLCKERPYGPDIGLKKLECCGHVQKRVGTRCRKKKAEFKSKKLSDGKTIGSAGRLTDKKVDTLQNYYGMAIRSNAGDLDAMVRDARAILPHVASTADRPMHQLCPEGPDSWCGFKRDNSTYKHSHGLPDAVYQFLTPMFDELSN
ncbi:uncharacterized protein LOC141909901 [Tubulanus polymorphus]|uniref:uncharacterized protein LOC141909901 n=1 Tax=Tubulanus polymorphus TaxID=672921 RepID=UPI003DA4ADC6